MFFIIIIIILSNYTQIYTRWTITDRKTSHEDILLELTDNILIEKPQKEKMISYPEGFPCE